MHLATSLLALLAILAASLQVSAAPATIPPATSLPKGQSATTTLANADLPCNGHPSLCSRRLTDVTFAGTHNSYATGSTNPAATQFTGITTQLNYGIRLLNLDIHWETKNGRRELYLCHGKCWILNRGRAADMLREVTSFMNANPREVVTIVFENGAGANAAEIEAVFREAGLIDRLYSQPASSPTWPTLGELIDRNKRLIVFAPGLPSIPAGQPQPLIMSQFDYVSETPYSLRSEGDWNCALDRPGGQARPLVLVNHWIYGKVLFIPIDVPSANNAKWVNKADKIRGHLNKCQSVRGQRINYVLVDFYEHGDLTEVVAGLNGVPYVAKPRPETKWRPLGDGDNAGTMAAPEVQALARLAMENGGKQISLDALDRGATVGITQ